MSKEPVPTVTEREAVLREREAYRHGVNQMFMYRKTLGIPEAYEARDLTIDRAAECYPLPKVKRLAVVKGEDGYWFALIEGALRYVRADGEEMARAYFAAVSDNVALADPPAIAALRQLPSDGYEEVDDE